MNTSAPAQTSSSQIFSTDLQPQVKIGTEVSTRDGRRFRYVQAGAVTLVVGNTLQAAAQITAHQAMAPVADVPQGATSFSVTPGAAAAPAGFYADGWLIVEVTPGVGYVYGVSGHGAITAATPFQVNLANDDPIQVGLTAAASKVTLIANPYRAVIQAPVTTLTGAPAGVAVYPIPANQWGWIQTKGPCGVLISGTPAVGVAVVMPGAVAGAVVVDGAANPTPVVGTMMVTGVDTHIQPVFLSFP